MLGEMATALHHMLLLRSPSAVLHQDPSYERTDQLARGLDWSRKAGPDLVELGGTYIQSCLFIDEELKSK